MADEWNYNLIKQSRVQHQCAKCKQKIKIGSSYVRRRQKGTFEHTIECYHLSCFRLAENIPQKEKIKLLGEGEKKMENKEIQELQKAIDLRGPLMALFFFSKFYQNRC
jgi:hypothetical protein